MSVDRYSHLDMCLCEQSAYELNASITDDPSASGFC